MGELQQPVEGSPPQTDAEEARRDRGEYQAEEGSREECFGLSSGEGVEWSRSSNRSNATIAQGIQVGPSQRSIAGTLGRCPPTIAGLHCE